MKFFWYNEMFIKLFMDTNYKALEMSQKAKPTYTSRAWV